MDYKELVIFQTDERSMNYKYFPDNEIDENEVSVLSIDYDKDLFVSKYRVQKTPKVGAVYFRVIDKEGEVNYVYISNLDGAIYDNKTNFYCDLGKMLGARKAKCNVIKFKSLSGGGESKSNFSIEEVGGNSKINIDALGKLKNQIEFERSFELLSNFDLDYQVTKARDLLKRLHLDKDPELNRLVNNRDPSLGSVMKKEVIKTHLTAEVNAKLEMASGLKCSAIEVDSGFNTRLEFIYDCYTEIYFEF